MAVTGKLKPNSTLTPEAWARRDYTLIDDDYDVNSLDTPPILTATSSGGADTAWAQSDIDRNETAAWGFEAPASSFDVSFLTVYIRALASDFSHIAPPEDLDWTGTNPIDRLFLTIDGITYTASNGVGVTGGTTLSGRPENNFWSAANFTVPHLTLGPTSDIQVSIKTPDAKPHELQVDTIYIEYDAGTPLS